MIEIDVWKIVCSCGVPLEWKTGIPALLRRLLALAQRILLEGTRVLTSDKKPAKPVSCPSSKVLSLKPPILSPAAV